MRNPQLEGIVGLTSWIWLSELVCVSYRGFGALGMYAKYKDVCYGTECIRPRLGLIEMGLPFVAISIHFPLAIYSTSILSTTQYRKSLVLSHADQVTAMIRLPRFAHLFTNFLPFEPTHRNIIH